MSIKIFCFLLILVFVRCSGTKHQYYTQTVKIPETYTLEQKVELSAYVLPSKGQMLWWQDEFKGFIHFGPNTFSGKEWGTGFENPKSFTPTELNTDQWCESMKSAGMTRIVLVVKHHEGFCLWQTRYTNHSVASSPWLDGKGDVLSSMVASCQKYNLKLGIYLSPADLYQIESSEGVYGNKSEYRQRTIPRAVDGRPFKNARTFSYFIDDYNEYFLNQLFEILTEYGPIYEVWLDGAHPKPGTGQKYAYDAWYDMVYKLQPNAVIFGKGPDTRWCGNEGGWTRDDEYNVLPLENDPATYDWPDRTEKDLASRTKITDKTTFFHYAPAETNTSIRSGWFWRNNDEQKVRTVDDVFDIYERSVGGNSQFHLNIPPDNRGLLAEKDVEVLKKVGKIITDVYSKNLLKDVKTNAPKVLDINEKTWWTPKSPDDFIEFTWTDFKKINRLVVKEAIEYRSERVEAHRLDAWINNTWTTIAIGKTIGHKRILRFPTVMTSKLRLYFTQYRQPPAISSVSIHYYDEPPKPVALKRSKDNVIELAAGHVFVWNGQYAKMDASQKIFYTLDGKEPTDASTLYNQSIQLNRGGRLRARAIFDNKLGSEIDLTIGVAKTNWKISANQAEENNLDKIIDANDKSIWTSTAKANAEIVIDLSVNEKINGIIFSPANSEYAIASLTVEGSIDGVNWATIKKEVFGNIVNDPSPRTILFEQGYDFRYLRFKDLMAPAAKSSIGIAEIEILSEK